MNLAERDTLWLFLWGLGWDDRARTFLEVWLPPQHQVCLVPGNVPTQAQQSVTREVPYALGLVPSALVWWNLGTGESASGVGGVGLSAGLG